MGVQLSFFKPLGQQLHDEENKSKQLYDKVKQQELKYKSNQLIKEQIHYRIRLYNYQKKFKWIPLFGFLKRFKLWFSPTKAMLINMELTTGDHTQFIAFINKTSFKYQTGEYVIDDEFKYYNVATKLWCLDYHQDLSIPIKRKINVNKIKKAVEQTGVTDVESSINPTTLRHFIESEVIQKVVQGQELDAIFKFLKIMLILTTIASSLTFIIVVQQSGILNNLGV